MKIDSEKIRKLMIDQGLNASDVAMALNVTKQAVSVQLSKGSCNPTNAQKHANLLGVRIDDIAPGAYIQVPKNELVVVLDRIASALEQLAEQKESVRIR